MSKKDNRYVNVKQVAEMFGCCVRKVHYMQAAGELPNTCHFPGVGFTRWKRKEIEQFIEDGFNAE
jgi:predicted DNA-binding transcriptional regulator AlpA